jgi:hypothetical protein
MAIIAVAMGRKKNDKPVQIIEETPMLGEEADEELDDRDDEDAEDDEDMVPCVVLGRLSDLRGFGDPALLRKHAERPVWFMIQDDADFMTLFDQLPERPVHRLGATPQAPFPPAISHSIMDVLRSFAAAESDALQSILGATDSIEFGFHERASVDDVAQAFEEDGFDVAFVLYEGKVVEPVDEDD